MLEADEPIWRWFASREVREARAWAASGGVAVHANFRRPRGHETAHLLARDEAALISAGAALGLGPSRIHRSRTPHFDLFGAELVEARRLCGMLTKGKYDELP